jgi:Mannosyltransferase (PIG-V)
MMENSENAVVVGPEPSPREPEWRRGLRVWMKRLRSIQYPLALAVGSTVLTFAFGVAAFMAVENKMVPGGWLEIWKRWDSIAYLDLAQHGYPYPQDPGPRQLQMVFLPVYPFAIRLMHLLIHDWALAAFVVSNLCCLGAFIYFFLLNRLEYNLPTARWAVFFLAIFPTAYFLHIGHSESIFIFLTIAAFYHARRSQWMLCGLFGMLATGSRIPGLAILPPLAWEYLQQRNFRWRQIRWDGLFLALVPLGTLAFFYLNYRHFGNPLHFLVAQKTGWGAHLNWPLDSVRGNWHGVQFGQPSERIVNYGGPLIIFFAATAALIVAAFRLRLCYTLYFALSWVVIFCNNWPVCSPRYVLSVFPLYMLGAQLCRRDWLRHLVALGCILLYALFSFQFARGWWGF